MFVVYKQKIEGNRVSRWERDAEFETLDEAGEYTKRKIEEHNSASASAVASGKVMDDYSYTIVME